jgi:phosphoribosylanthranilate isomerase
VSTFVKICGITNEADALLGVGLGADAIGVIFAPSPRQVSLATAGDIVRRLPPETMTIGVFRDDAPMRVVEIANQLGLRGVQLHGHESEADVSYVAERVPLVIKALPATNPDITAFEGSAADLLLVDGPSPGSGDVFDWRLAEGMAHAHRLIVSGGLNADNVRGALEQLHPFGVDVATGVEMAPGVKDPRRLRDFIEEVRSFDDDHPDDVFEDEDDGPFDWMRN